MPAVETPTPPAAEVYAPVEVEREGRTLTGVNVTAAELEATMDAREPENTPATPDTASKPVEPTPVPDAVKNTRGRRRFELLKHQAEEAQQERDRLKAELDALKSRPVEPVAPVVRSEPAPPAPAVRPQPVADPEPTEDQIGTVYQTYPEFQKALTNWAVRQQLAQLPSPQQIEASIRARLDAERAQQTFAQTAEAIRARGQQVYPDFQARIQALPVVFPHVIAKAIVDFPESEHLQYALATNPTKAQAIASMTDPFAIGRAFAELVPPGLSARPASPALTAPVTSAPAPYQPVGASSKTTVPSLAALADHGDDYDTSGYRERRRQELRGR